MAYYGPFWGKCALALFLLSPGSIGVVCGCSPRDAFQQQLRVLLVRHVQLCGSAVQRGMLVLQHTHTVSNLRSVLPCQIGKHFPVLHTHKKSSYTLIFFLKISQFKGDSTACKGEPSVK